MDEAIYFLCILVLFSHNILIAAYTLTASQSISDGQTLVSQGEKFELGFFSPSNTSKNRYIGICFKTIPVRTVVWVANRESPIPNTSGVFKIDTTAGMKIGWDLKTGKNRYLTSWRNLDDPSRGDFTYGYDLKRSYPEVTMRKDSNMYYRAGPWNGIRNSGAPDLRPNSIFTYQVVKMQKNHISHANWSINLLSRVLFCCKTEHRAVLIDMYGWRIVIVSLSFFQFQEIVVMHMHFVESTAHVNVAPCQCLEGFKPKSPEDWSATDWTQGCEREVPLKCNNGEGFSKYPNVKLPDTTNSWLTRSLTLEECRYSSDGQDLYIRMPASELGSEAKSKAKKSVTTIAGIASVAGIILLGLGSWYVWKKRDSKVNGSERGDLELPLYSFATLNVATDNFSAENKLGEGGFGPVYKGKLKDRQEIAVKRLSKDSTQGVDAFKNEVVLIAKLQHINLVKLLGCCIQKEEKMLVYEYMPNKSLDLSIFDETKGRLLDWRQRLQIIQGIAEGLHYLHHSSRLRIVHRDLKASNVLLDDEMVPKISDFGMARIFRRDQVEAKTKIVVGTYGYMSPEYVINGHFSAKSDVFSFGVLVLEIISGQRNWGFRCADYELNLLGHAWKLWSEDRSSELVDKLLSDSGVNPNVLRCIHIGLLCVQSETIRRPTISSVMIMLVSETSGLPNPQKPGFYMDRSPQTSNPPGGDKDPHNSDNFTITVVEGR